MITLYQKVELEDEIHCKGCSEIKTADGWCAILHKPTKQERMYVYLRLPDCPLLTKEEVSHE